MYRSANAKVFKFLCQIRHVPEIPSIKIPRPELFGLPSYDYVSAFWRDNKYGQGANSRVGPSSSFCIS
jgi:hypothetical protein